MGEQSGKIVFINSHDYVSDITGETWIGCLASLRRTDDSERGCEARSTDRSWRTAAHPSISFDGADLALTGVTDQH